MIGREAAEDEPAIDVSEAVEPVGVLLIAAEGIAGERPEIEISEAERRVADVVEPAEGEAGAFGRVVIIAVVVRNDDRKAQDAVPVRALVFRARERDGADLEAPAAAVRGLRRRGARARPRRKIGRPGGGCSQ